MKKKKNENKIEDKKREEENNKNNIDEYEEKNDNKKLEELNDKIQIEPNVNETNEIQNNEENKKKENIKFRNKPNKIEVKDKTLENEKHNEEEEEEDDDKNTNKVLEKGELKGNPNDPEIIDLSKYELLSKIININLEAKGFNNSDIKKDIDELFNNFPDPILPDELKNKLSEQIIKLMDISLDSDKTEINNFISDLVDFNEGNTNKIYEQLMKYIEGIVDQENLTTRKMNRYIRSCIQKCKDKLKNRLKEEDIPSDKVINLEKFEKIVEETGIELKEPHMDVLLYQMKKAVPKGRNFNTLNAIVIVDFLK